MSYYYIRPKFRLYPREIVDILIAAVVLTLSLSILWGGFHYFLFYLPISAVAVITGFLMHEMAHKYMAMRFGFPAAFRAWYPGLLLALIFVFLGFMFAAPGAVMVYGLPTRRENGLISAVGPITNIIFGFVALIVSLAFPQLSFLIIIAYFNFFLAFFNLLPFPPMDGLKIFAWNVFVYLALMGASLGGLVIFYLS